MNVRVEQPLKMEAELLEENEWRPSGISGLDIMRIVKSGQVEKSKTHKPVVAEKKLQVAEVVAEKKVQEAKMGLKMEEKKKVRRDSKAKLKLAEFKRQMLQVTLWQRHVAAERKVQEAEVGLKVDKEEKKQTEGDLSAKQRVKLVKSKGRKDLENRERLRLELTRLEREEEGEKEKLALIELETKKMLDMIDSTLKESSDVAIELDALKTRMENLEKEKVELEEKRKNAKTI